MGIFAISDLHLSLGADKPMDVFGSIWENYEQRLKENWERAVGPQDLVIVNGDNSWATYLENATEDFSFIHSLPGIKLLSKGNHDYWWSTVNKQNLFCRRHGFDSICFLHNNHYLHEGTAVCGTKGRVLTTRDDEDLKLYHRETERLLLSLRSAQKAKPEKIIAALHYPPDEEFRRILKENGVSVCVYGHLHDKAHRFALDHVIDGVEYYLVSCDFLTFNPLKLV